MCTRDDDTFNNETSFQGSRYALAFAASGQIFFSLPLSLGGSNLFFEGETLREKILMFEKTTYDKKEGGGQPKISELPKDA